MPVELDAGRARGARGLARRARPAAACSSSCRSAARSAACSIWRRATPRWRISRISATGAVVSVRRARHAARGAESAGAAAAHRVLRHLDAAGPRDRRVDGRVRGRPDAAGRVPEVQDHGASGHAARHRTVGTGVSLADSGRLRLDARGRPAALPAGCSSRAGRFPISILIDGGKGQLTAAYAALRELGLERLVAVGLAKQEELLFTRDRVEGLALPPQSAAAAPRPAHPRRGAPVCRDVPSARPRRSATCGRSSTRSPASARAGASSC